jgi:hypothetical protein
VLRRLRDSLLLLIALLFLGATMQASACELACATTSGPRGCGSQVASQGIVSPSGGTCAHCAEFGTASTKHGLETNHKLCVTVDCAPSLMNAVATSRKTDRSGLALQSTNVQTPHRCERSQGRLIKSGRRWRAGSPERFFMPLRI